MATKKIGRPKSKTPKTIELRTRVDEKTNEMVNKYCLENGITRSDFLRKGIDLVLQKK